MFTPMCCIRQPPDSLQKLLQGNKASNWRLPSEEGSYWVSTHASSSSKLEEQCNKTQTDRFSQKEHTSNAYRFKWDGELLESATS